MAGKKVKHVTWRGKILPKASDIPKITEFFHTATEGMLIGFDAGAPTLYMLCE